MTSRPSYRAAEAVAVLLVALYAVANLLDLEHLWSLNLATFLPPWWFWLSLALLVLSLVPRAQRLVMAMLETASQKKAARRTALVLGAALAVAAVLFYPRTYFLGDGNLRLNQILSGTWWLPTEAGDFFLHAALYNLVLEPLGIDVAWSYHIISGLAGVVFVLGVASLSIHAARQRWAVVLAALLATVLMVQFIGYVESYALLAAIVPWFLLACLQAADGTGRTWLVLGLYVAAAVIHSGAAIFLAGAVASILLLPLIRSGPPRLWRLLPPGLAITAVAVAYALRGADLWDLSYYVIPPVPTPDFNQGFATVRYWLNIANWVLPMTMPLLVLGVAGARDSADHSEPGRSIDGTLAIWAVTPPTVFVLFFTPHLGGPRDWDLFSMAIYIVFAVLVVTRIRAGVRVPRALVPSVVLPLVLTVSLVWINAAPGRAVDRFVEIIEVSKFKNLFKEYKMLYTFVDMRPELRGLGPGFARLAWEQPPYTLADSLFMLERLSRIAIDQGDPTAASRYLDLAMQADSSDVNTYLAMINYLQQSGNRDDLLRLAGVMERHLSDNPLGRMNAGVVYMQLGMSEAGARNITEAFSLDSTNERIVVNYATLQYQQGNFRRAAELFVRAAELDPTEFLSHYYAAASFQQLGQEEAARRYLDEASMRAVTPEQQRMVSSLQREIEGGAQ